MRLAAWSDAFAESFGIESGLREAGWAGFKLRPNEFHCPVERGSVEALRALFEAVYAAIHRPG